MSSNCLWGGEKNRGFQGLSPALGFQFTSHSHFPGHLSGQPMLTLGARRTPGSKKKRQAKPKDGDSPTPPAGQEMWGCPWRCCAEPRGFCFYSLGAQAGPLVVCLQTVPRGWNSGHCCYFPTAGPADSPAQPVICWFPLGQPGS